MRKVFLVFLSLLLVFLMVPVLPGAAYAADAPARTANLHYTPEAEQFYQAIAPVGKIPGAAAAVPGGPKGAPITEDIEDASAFVDPTLPSSGWIAIDNDGDGYNWFYAAADEDYSTFNSLSGEDGECVTSASYINFVGELTPDNWLISPAFQVPSNTQLQYYVCGQDSDWCNEHYGVYISTTSQTDISSFTLLFQETVQSGNYVGKAVDLTSYAGQTVYIAFRHYDITDMYFLNLDGIGLADAGTDPNSLDDPTLVRIFGANRYETSIEVAEKLLDYVTVDAYPNAIIATGDNFADALAGSALSTATGAPILLISNKVPSSVDAALDFISENVDPSGTVFILGGTGVVPDTLEGKLDELGMDNMRFAGAGRYETNLAVLEFMRDNIGIYEVMICDGTNWPDAATASAVGNPIMLVAKSGLSQAQKDFLASAKELAEADSGYPYFWMDVIGGPGAVSDEIYNSIIPYQTYSDELPWRLAGANRAETAVAVAEEFYYMFAGGIYDSPADFWAVTFAYGANYPDCIAGGLLANVLGAPILYGDSKAPGSYMQADIPLMGLCLARDAFILGGETLISDQFVLDLMDAAAEYAGF